MIPSASGHSTVPPCLGRGVLEGLVDVHHLVEAADLEGAAQAGAGTRHPQVGVAAAGPGEAVDEHAQPGRVDEADAGQIDDDRGRPVVDEASELVPERGHGGDVDLALCGQHRVSPQLLYLEACVDLGDVSRPYSSSRSAEMKASWGTSTRPMFFIRRLPSFWRSRSLRFRETSPP